MTSDDYMTGSMSSANLIESNYTLALKFFMNKNFAKSFDILRNQYPHLFDHVLSGVIEESIFVKVLNLYLTEVGLILQSSHEFKVNKAEKQDILRQLNDDYILNNLVHFYADLNAIPPEILYNLYLISYIGLDLNVVHTKLLKVYGKLDFVSDDKYLKKLVELLAIRILPELQLYSDAKQLVNENPLLQQKQEYLDHITQLETEQAMEKDQKERNKQKSVRESLQRQQKEKEEKDLKYRSLKQIKETQQPLMREEPTPKTTDLDALKQKLLYNLNFSKNWIKNHSPLILLVVVAFFISRRVLKAKKVDLVKNFKETLGMAFKISYL